MAKEFSDERIIASWRKNVLPWVSAIQDNEIESRLLVTNDAIINAILESKPKAVLDVGCGEGWLVRKLVANGIKSIGIDVVPEFIAYAKKKGCGEFLTLPYDEISPDTFDETFDAIVCNFSLLGNESVNHLFQQIPLLLGSGVFIVQTIHPIANCGDEKYEDGWRKGSWSGFSDKFCDPAPWYFRTIESWKSLFSRYGLSLIKTVEPLNPKTRSPASIIFMAAKSSLTQV